MRSFILIGLCLLLVSAPHRTGRGQQREAPPKTEGPPRLSNEDELALRNDVYKGSAKSTIPREGEWKGFEILIVPKEVKAIYAKDKRATIRVLLKIVQGGRPSDSKIAAGYAISLMDSPVGGLMFTSGVDRDYDVLGKGDLWTLREVVVDRVTEQFEKLNKDLASAPKK